MKLGDLVKISITRESTWAYRGTVCASGFNAGAYLPNGTVGLNLGPSDPRFPKFEPLAVLIEDEIWTLPSSHLEPIFPENT